MSYFIEVKPAVAAYLADPERVPAATGAIVLDGMINELAADADKFAARRPLAPESHRFEYDYPHPDATAGLVYVFRFICDGSAMAQGVVQVVFVDRDDLPIP